MMYPAYDSMKVWTWEDLQNRIVKVVYHPGSPDTLEPPMLMFLDIENQVGYLWPQEAKKEEPDPDDPMPLL